MADDSQLLRRYVETRSEGAFAEIVQSHLAIVYHAALRQIGSDPHLAEDVTQAVFVQLAQKAPALVHHTSLVGWLYTTTYFKATKARRERQRRQIREQQMAFVMSELSADSATEEWGKVRPVIDQALIELNDDDREAVLLRFFQNRSFAEIAERLNLTENTAHKRVERALEKLRGRLAKRGIDSSAAALVATFGTQAALAAPSGLIATVTGAAVASSLSVTTLASGIALMNTKITTVVHALFAAVAISAALYEVHTASSADARLTAIQEENLAAVAHLASIAQQIEWQTKENAALQSNRDQAWRAPSPPPAQAIPDAVDPVAAGQEFLARHPEAKKLLDAYHQELHLRLRSAPFRGLGYTVKERREIFASTRDFWPTTRNISAGGNVSVGGLRFPFKAKNNPDFLRALIGEQHFQQMAEIERLDAARSFAETAVAVSYDTDSPFSTEQAEAIVQSLDRHKRTSSVGIALRLVDWAGVVRDLTPLFSPSQLAILEAARVSADGIDMASVLPPRGGRPGR